MHTQTHMNTQRHTHTHKRHTHEHTHMQRNTDTYTDTHIHTKQTHAPIHTCIHTHEHTQVHTHANTQTHSHTDTHHTQKHTDTHTLWGTGRCSYIFISNHNSLFCYFVLCPAKDNWHPWFNCLPKALIYLDFWPPVWKWMDVVINSRDSIYPFSLDYGSSSSPILILIIPLISLEGTEHLLLMKSCFSQANVADSCLKSHYTGSWGRIMVSLMTTHNTRTTCPNNNHSKDNNNNNNNNKYHCPLESWKSSI